MSNIEWTGETWNAVLGCTKISPGCDRCYAIDQAYRNREMAKALEPEKRGRLGYYEGLTKKVNGQRQWTGEIVFVEEALEIPFKRKKPQTYFVNSMSDLFHERVKIDWIYRIFEVMDSTPHHTYQILTKRPERMFEIMDGWEPLPNVWLGTTIENQKAVSDRAEHLYKLHNRGWTTFYSVEPLIEPVELYLRHEKVDWVIAGGESGYGARPCHYEWISSIVEQCRLTDTPVFVKQFGANPFMNGQSVKHSITDKKGGNLGELPADIRIREFPKQKTAIAPQLQCDRAS